MVSAAAVTASRFPETDPSVHHQHWSFVMVPLTSKKGGQPLGRFKKAAWRR
jgi:hypothetical protein